MSKQRPRTARRIEERAARKLVRDREKLAALLPGGARERPIEVPSSSVIEVRVESMPCPQCEGRYRLREHEAPAPGLRRVDVTCRNCGAPRSLWFRIVTDEPN
ncbi:MAG TPA: hypothetical protein VM513_33480 [Kofleriaceae bacterium]|nr:hypothetical protein [Kofleriaceae bacterium]